MKTKRKVIPLNCQRKKQPTLLQLLSTAARHRRVKELIRNNKTLARALEESQCIAASNTSMLQKYAKETNQILLARMKINEMAQTIQKLVGDLNDVARYLDVETISTVPNIPEGPRTISREPDLSKIDETLTSVTGESMLEESQQRKSNSTRSSDLCSTLDSSATEVYNVQQSIINSNNSLGYEGLMQLNSTPADINDMSPPTPQLNLIPFISSNITELVKCGSPYFKNNTKQKECPALLISNESGHSEIPVDRLDLTIPLLRKSKSFGIHNIENHRETFVEPIADNNPNISSASLRKESYTLNNISKELSSVKNHERQPTFIVPALSTLPKTKPKRNVDCHPISVDLCADEETLHLSEDMELTEVIPSSAVSMAYNPNQNQNANPEEHCPPFAKRNDDFLSKESLKPNLKIDEYKSEVSKISGSNKDNVTETPKLTINLAIKNFGKSPLKRLSQVKSTFPSCPKVSADNTLAELNSSDLSAGIAKPTKRSSGRKSLRPSGRLSLGCRKSIKISSTHEKTKDIDQTAIIPTDSISVIPSDDFYLSDSDEEVARKSKPLKTQSKKSIKGLKAVEKSNIASFERNVNQMFQEQNLGRKSLKRRVSFADANLTSEEDKNNGNAMHSVESLENSNFPGKNTAQLFQEQNLGRKSLKRRVSFADTNLTSEEDKHNGNVMHSVESFENTNFPGKDTALIAPRRSILKKRISVYENNQPDKGGALLKEQSEKDQLLHTEIEINNKTPEPFKKSLINVDKELTETDAYNIIPIVVTPSSPELSMEESFLNNKGKRTFSGVSERSSKRKYTGEDDDFLDAFDILKEGENFSLEPMKDDVYAHIVKNSLSNQSCKRLSEDCRDNTEVETVMNESVEIQQNESEQQQPLEVENIVENKMIVEVEEENQISRSKSGENAKKVKKTGRKPKSANQRKTGSTKSSTSKSKKKKSAKGTELEQSPKPLTENKANMNKQYSTPDISELKNSIGNIILHKEEDTDVENGGRRRRVRALKSYKEVPLNVKMRREK